MDIVEDFFIDRNEIQKESKDSKYIVLIIYDIVNNKSRTKFAKYLSSYGKRVQKSAFEAVLSKKQYLKLVEGVPSRISKEDSVRIYKLTGLGEIKTWGKNEIISEEIIVI